MHFLSVFLAILLVGVTTNLYAFNTKAASPVCRSQSQCPKTHFCNIRQRACIQKYSLNSTCQEDRECAGNKCYGNICRRPCQSDTECSLTKEYCTVTNYCDLKHCGMCGRHAQCANHICRVVYCLPSNCTTALNALKKL